MAYFVSPERRIYIPFLLSSAVLAGLVYLRRRREGTAGGRGLWGFLFPRDVWWHPSARLDYRIFVTDSLLRALLFPTGRVPVAAISAGISVLLQLSLGARAAADGSRLTYAVLYSLALFLAHDLSRYLLHSLLHRVPLLWEFHKVHHSAQVLTPFTIYRSHPLESLLYTLRGIITTGTVSGLFFYFFRESLGSWDVLGINAFGLGFSIIGANLRHSHIWLPFGPRIEHVVMSPAQHQLHHSAASEHQGRNLGAFLSLWDWLGGTLCVAVGRPELRLGLGEGEPSHADSVRSAYVQPFVNAYRQLRQPANGEGHVRSDPPKSPGST